MKVKTIFVLSVIFLLISFVFVSSFGASKSFDKELMPTAIENIENRVPVIKKQQREILYRIEKIEKTLLEDLK